MMTNGIQNKIWILRDEYIDKTIAGESIDIDEFCNSSGLGEQEKSELWEILNEYEASQKALDNIISRNVDSDRIWEKLQKRIAKGVVVPIDNTKATNNRYRMAASDSSDNEDIKSRMMREFTHKEISFEIFKGELLYSDLHSVDLVFKEGDNITSKLDGYIIELFVEGQKKQELEIRDSFVTISFDDLGISIEDYSKIGYQVKNNERIIDKGSFGDE